MKEMLISAEEVEKLLGVKRQTLYMWARQGLIPFYRVGKRLIRFNAEELLDSFKVERDPGPTQAPKVCIPAGPVTEPFRALKQTESSEANRQRERYRAMLGVIE